MTLPRFDKDLNPCFVSNDKLFTLYQGDCNKILPQCENSIDLIFADPPYAIEGLADIPDKIFAKDILNDGCYFILEHPDTYSFEGHPFFVKEKKYGNVHFSFFEKK